MRRDVAIATVAMLIGLAMSAIATPAQAETIRYGTDLSTYSWQENSPPGCGIEYPQYSHTYCPTNGVNGAGGIGTWTQPETFAAAYGWWQPGTIIYVPMLKDYFILDDVCGTCTGRWMDLWIGKDDNYGDPTDYINLWVTNAEIIVNPPSNLPVDTVHLNQRKI
jgi:3D (Asp-Asp-Asp) domain-containing protein